MQLLPILLFILALCYVVNLGAAELPPGTSTRIAPPAKTVDEHKTHAIEIPHTGDAPQGHKIEEPTKTDEYKARKPEEEKEEEHKSKSKGNKSDASDDTASPNKPKTEAAKVSEEEEQRRSLYEQFDPQTYTCQQFLDDNKNHNQDTLDLAMVWLHGFFTAMNGTEEVITLNEESASDFNSSVTTFCKQNVTTGFAKAATALMRD